MKQVIVVRKDLDLSAGKIAAQAVHASSRTGYLHDYTADRQIACIVTTVKSEEKLLKLHKQCLDAGIPCGLQRDGGHTEVDFDTATVLSIGPAEDDAVNKITKRLQLLKGEVSWQ